MAKYDKQCPTCNVEFIATRKDKTFCSRLCYRRSPGVKERYRYRNDKNRDKNKYEPKWRHQRLQSSARKRNLEMSIGLDEYVKLIENGCHYCESNILKETGCGLDRIDNSKGYTLNNIVPCCGKCNQIRNVHLTKDEMEVAMKAVLKYRGELNG